MQVIQESINHVTGEVVSEERTSAWQVDKEPDYVKLYIQDIMRLKDLPLSTSTILMCLLRNMGYNNLILAYAPIKNLICIELNISMNTLNKSIDNLYKQNILIRVARGIYLADPELFGRGKWTDIKDLRMTVHYDETGKKTINTNVSKEQLKLF